MNKTSTSKKSIKLYSDALVWDAHAGVFPSPKVDLNLLDSWSRNGANYVSMNVGFDVMAWHQTLGTLAAYRRWILMNSERYVLAGSVADIVEAKHAGKFAVSFDIEGMNALNGDINMVSLYHALGVRQMLFAYNLNNNAAGGCHDTDRGLTSFGKQIVAEMNRVGVIVDCSHAAYRTTMDIMAESAEPVVFSHSNPRGLCNHQRNIKDDQISACAESGGVVGINGMGIFLGENDTSTKTVVEHICYVSDLVGAEHVGFGFDYSPKTDVDVSEILASRPDYWPAGNRYDTRNIGHVSPSQLPDIAEGLIQRGFDDSEILGFLGGNFQRVAERVWTVN